MVDAAGLLANDAAVERLAERGLAGPAVGFILGSGWGAFVERTETLAACPFGEIPGFGESTVQGHAGRLVRGRAAGREYLAMQGRLHHYEGHSLQRIGSAVRVMQQLGVRELVVTNAAGAVNPAFEVGDVVLLTDFVNFILKSPLRGADGAVRAGVAISARLVAEAERAAEGAGIALRKGVLFTSKGPSYETPAESRMARQLGADVVSMSTAPELIAAGGLGMETVAFSCVTNMAPGVVPGRAVDHAEVMEVTKSREELLTRLLAAVLSRFETARPRVRSGEEGRL
ncbi:MAG: purine-nucleoside phosphorylase [bacterium]